MNIHCLYEHFHDYTCENLNEPDEHFMNIHNQESHFVLPKSQPSKIVHKWFCIQNLHMGDFTQPQQEYADTGENLNIAISVIFIQ